MMMYLKKKTVWGRGSFKVSNPLPLGLYAWTLKLVCMCVCFDWETSAKVCAFLFLLVLLVCASFVNCFLFFECEAPEH